MSAFANKLPTISANTMGVNILVQKTALDAIFSDMNEVWLKLHTKEGGCPIVEQMGTNVKRKLVREYAVELIDMIRANTSLTLITSVSNPDAAFWHADDIVQRISDGMVIDHKHLFCGLLTSIFGLGIKVAELMFKEKITVEDLYDTLKDFYFLTLNTLDLDDEVTPELIIGRLESYIKDEDKPLFEVDTF